MRHESNPRAVILLRLAIVPASNGAVALPTEIGSRRIRNFRGRAKIHTTPGFSANRRARFGDFPELSETNRLQLQCFRQTLRALSGKCAVDSIGKGSVR
jgi:hypothetical protein